MKVIYPGNKCPSQKEIKMQLSSRSPKLVPSLGGGICMWLQVPDFPSQLVTWSSSLNICIMTQKISNWWIFILSLICFYFFLHRNLFSNLFLNIKTELQITATEETPAFLPVKSMCPSVGRRRECNQTCPSCWGLREEKPDRPEHCGRKCPSLEAESCGSWWERDWEPSRLKLTILSQWLC